MTMIEKVARAIHGSLGYDQNWPHPECTQCVAAARAAITAMRKPTPIMFESAAKQREWEHGFWMEGPTSKVWEAMIESILSEK